MSGKTYQLTVISGVPKQLSKYAGINEQRTVEKYDQQRQNKHNLPVVDVEDIRGAATKYNYKQAYQNEPCANARRQCVREGFGHSNASDDRQNYTGKLNSPGCLIEPVRKLISDVPMVVSEGTHRPATRHGPKSDSGKYKPDSGAAQHRAMIVLG